MVKKNHEISGLTRYLKTALLAALEAGHAILEIYDGDFMVRYKDDMSPLTMADKRSHDIIVKHLSDQNGDKIPILSEEGRDIPFQERKKWSCFWLIDPLDGTKEFIKRNGEFTVNIALVHEARPILGIIYMPVKDLFYFAATDLGAYKMEKHNLLAVIKDNADKKGTSKFVNEIIGCSTKLPHHLPHTTFDYSQVTIVGSRSHPTKKLEDFVADMRKKYRSVEFISAGSSLKLCLVAEGKADIYPRLGPTMEWDTAAGQIIVEQAKGSVLNFETNEPLQYNKKDLLNPWFIVSKKSA